MPYRNYAPSKRFRRRRTYRRKSTFPRKVMGYASMAVSAYKMAKYLKSLINVEQKRNMNIGTVNPTSTVASIVYLTGTAQGVTESQRSGNSILGKSLSIKLDLVKNSAGSNAVLSRNMLIHDNSPDGVLPDINDILDPTSTAPLVFRQYNNETMGNRFKILMDKTNTLDVTTPRQEVRRYFPIHSHQKYQGATAAITDSATGHYFLVSVSSEATNVPANNYVYTYSFVDN